MKTDFNKMIGETLVEVKGTEKGSDIIVFKTQSGRHFELYHEHDCCEEVFVEDISGDVQDLIGKPLLMCEEVNSYDHPPPDSELMHKHYSHTWTFYKLATVNGYVTIRWLGMSSGCYSEIAAFQERIEK